MSEIRGNGEQLFSDELKSVSKIGKNIQNEVIEINNIDLGQKYTFSIGQGGYLNISAHGNKVYFASTYNDEEAYLSPFFLDPSDAIKLGTALINKATSVLDNQTKDNNLKYLQSVLRYYISQHYVSEVRVKLTRVNVTKNLICPLHQFNIKPIFSAAGKEAMKWDKLIFEHFNYNQLILSPKNKCMYDELKEKFRFGDVEVKVKFINFRDQLQKDDYDPNMDSQNMSDAMAEYFDGRDKSSKLPVPVEGTSSEDLAEILTHFMDSNIIKDDKPC